MKLAHILPISLLRCVPVQQRTHLVLSELVLSNSAYYRFYAARAQEGDRIILDNPVHEDRPVTIDRWLDAVKLMMPDVAVIPDVIDSDDETIANVMKAVEVFNAHRFSGIQLMAVPHGETQQDWARCACLLASIPEISWFGISLERRLNDDMEALRRRRERVQFMNTYASTFHRIALHLLGVSESGAELGDDKIWQRASSADVSKFAVWNMLGTPVTPPVPITRPYPGRGPLGGSYGYFFAEPPRDLNEKKMQANLRRWTNYADRSID